MTRFLTDRRGRVSIVNIMTERRYWAPLRRVDKTFLKACLSSGQEVQIQAATGVGGITDTVWQLVLNGETYESCLARGRVRLGFHMACKGNPRDGAHNRTLTHNGRTQTIADWARELGMFRSTIQGRLNRGEPPERALHKGVLRLDPHSQQEPVAEEFAVTRLEQRRRGTARKRAQDVATMTQSMVQTRGERTQRNAMTEAGR